MSSKKKTPTTTPKPLPTPKGNVKRHRSGILVRDDDATPETPTIVLEVMPDEAPRVATDESNAVMPWDRPTETPAEPVGVVPILTKADRKRIAKDHVLGGSGVLATIGNEWIAHLKATGTSDSTVASYVADFGTAKTHFGSMDDPAMWTEEDVIRYENATSVTHTKSGKPKAMPTIMKTRRVLRMALTWAHETGRLASLPYACKGRIPVAQTQE